MIWCFPTCFPIPQQSIFQVCLTDTLNSVFEDVILGKER